MKIISVPCLQDNYAYLIICEDTGGCGIVDPSEAEPVLRAVAEHQADLVAIFNTHHHWDHVGGNKAILEAFPDLMVYGHASDRGRIPGQNVFLQDQQQISLGMLQGHVTHNPGHTTGAVTYYFDDTAFTGDTLFAAGCGRLFEGTPEDMHRSLNHAIGQHEDETRLFFGHEYTEKNLRFAQTVEPSNSDIAEKLEEVIALRKQGLPTTPTTLAEEWATNPFMRVDSEEIQKTVKLHDPSNDLSPSSVLRVIRQLKDAY